MAKEQKKADAPKTATASAPAKKAQKRPEHVHTNEELKKMGKKGNTLVVVRLAYQLASRNKFTGTKLAGVKSPAGSFYGKIKPTGIYWKIGEDSEDFKKVNSLAKAAVSDIKASKYTGAVSSLIEGVLALSGGKGSRVFNPGTLSDISL